MEQGADRIRFGPFEMDTGRRLLLRDTKPVRLGSRALDILVAFLAQPGQLLAADDLIAQAWPRRTMAEANLRAHILSLRRALGDGKPGSTYIQNVPGRGYRFVFPLEKMPQQVPQQHHGEAPDSRRMIGRANIVSAILAGLARRRLITIVGPGGIGKTTVCAAVVGAFAPLCADGAHWVDLGALPAGESLAEAVALAIGLTSFKQDPTPGVLAWMGNRDMLLVLDCCDRVVEDVAAFAERVHRETPRVRILATSREVLRVTGEHVVRLAPLPVPPEAGALSVAQAASYPAVQLFVERAASVLGGFALNETNVAAVARICARLDGIALAIELAAGHLVAIEIHQLATLLDDRFRLLAAGRRTALLRHRTMHAALEWSYETLTGTERHALLCLAIFEGETSLSSIHAVAASPASKTDDLTGALGKLVDKSLVLTKVTPSGLRYRVLDTTRAFVLGRLAESSAFQHISYRHAMAVTAILNQVDTDTQAISVADWLAVRRREVGNARAALNWAYGAEAGQAIRLALSVAAARMLCEVSLSDQCRRRSAQALDELARAGVQDLRLEMRLRAFMAFASFYTPGPVAETVEMLERVAAIAAELGDEEYRATALWGLWSTCIFRGEPEKALACTEGFGAVRGGLSEAVRQLLVGRMAGTTHHLAGNQSVARTHLEHVSTEFDPALHGWSTLGFHIHHGLMARIYLARVLWLQGLPDQAQQTCEACVASLQSQGHVIAQCHALFEVAIPLSYLNGDTEAARSSAKLLQDLAVRHGLATFEAGAAWIHAALDAIQFGTDLCLCQEAARALRASRYDVQTAWLSGVMAEEALRRGDIAAGIDWLEPHLARCAATGLRWWLPELLRLRAELCVDGAMRSYLDQSLEIAREQGARSLELRSLMSCFRLGCGHDAERLRTVFDAFTEGFDTADLLAARGILGKESLLF